MKTLLRALAVIGLVVLLAVVGVAVALSTLPFSNASIGIDGETLSLSGLGGWQAALAVAAAALALVGVAAAALLGILAALVVALLTVAVIVAAVAFTLLLLASPLILVGWLVWRTVSAAKPGTGLAAAA